jgi:hypothetical protein
MSSKQSRETKPEAEDVGKINIEKLGIRSFGN